MSRDLGTMLGELLAAHSPPGRAALVRASVALLCRERALGHLCIDLAPHADAPAQEGGECLPSAGAWRDGLLTSEVVGEPGAGPPLPLVLDGTRLYLRRDHDAEARTVRALQRRLGAEPVTSPARIRMALAQLDLQPDPDAPGEPDWQLAAIVTGLCRRFLLLTGGPGTGKTTTVARLLSALFALDDGLRVALAAPTGKAAARMGEAIAAHAADDLVLRAHLPDLRPQTLHRLLGYLPLEDAFRHGRDRRLPHDVVVVDEASMLDPALLAVLLEALPESARLVLVGDRDQLAAVAAGQVLGDLCRAAAPERGVGPGLADLVAAATGMRLPVQPDAPPIADAVIALRVNHRFGRQPGLDHFAQALANRAPDRALEVLAAGHPDLSWAADAPTALAAIEQDLLAAACAGREQALAMLGRLRILAASRHGDTGVLAWNRRVEALLSRHGVRVDAPWYRGRPILVTANDHQNRLYNGDLGVVARDQGGRPSVLFATANGAARAINPSRLPAHETAWAMTVHKAQGSEFDTVVLSMPDEESPLWQAPLLYTGITRARRRAVLLADPTLLEQGLRRWPERGSGLGAAMARR